jgi:hypothetical protein
MLLEGKSISIKLKEKVHMYRQARKLKMIYSPNIQQQMSNTSIKSVGQPRILR